MAEPRRSSRLLVVDDDPGLLEVLELLLSREGYAAERAPTRKQGVERAAAGDIDLVITDLKLPDGTGLDVIRELRALQPALPIIMITSYSSMESAIAALRAGAVDYLIKPFENDELVHAVERALNERRMSRENAILKRNLRSAYGARAMIGESPGIKRVQELVRKAAPSDANVLVSGEAGSGKELVALTLHYSSPRADRPLVSVGCGGLARGELEAELLGREGGPEGLVRDADGGTLFLDEVAELPAALQMKLVHMLEEKTVRPLGGKRSYPVDVRIVAGTQRDLAAETERGRFRADLFYRLNVISIDVPPLRSRGGDALLLAQHFAKDYAVKLGKRVPRFDAEFSAFIQNYPWPGNVRELENMIERAVILAEAEELTGRDLAEVAPALPMLRAATPLPGDARPLAIEEYIREVVERFQDSHTETELARMLGIGRKALWMRRRQWGLKRSRRSVSR
jgi:DNA-binding NtrC family response regulator